MEETLGVHRLGVWPLPRRSLSSTKIMELCLSTVREVAGNPAERDWPGGDQITRWTGTAGSCGEPAMHTHLTCCTSTN